MQNSLSDKAIPAENTTSTLEQGAWWKYKPKTQYKRLDCYVTTREYFDRLCSLVVRVSGYRSRGPGSISGATRFFLEVVGLERGPLSLVSTSEELLDRKVAAPV
jgi:hypothetical protein